MQLTSILLDAFIYCAKSPAKPKTSYASKGYLVAEPYLAHVLELRQEFAEVLRTGQGVDLCSDGVHEALPRHHREAVGGLAQSR